MDGINPTLAFAVLFFGLSGNSREPADTQTQIEVQARSACSVLMIADDAAQPPAIETWSDAFWKSADDTSGLTHVIEPKWSDAVPPEPDGAEATGDAAAVALAPGTDPIMRQAVPVGLNGLAADADVDPCAPDR